MKHSDFIAEVLGADRYEELVRSCGKLVIDNDGGVYVNYMSNDIDFEYVKTLCSSYVELFELISKKIFKTVGIDSNRSEFSQLQFDYEEDTRVFRLTIPLLKLTPLEGVNAISYKCMDTNTTLYDLSIASDDPSDLSVELLTRKKTGIDGDLMIETLKITTNGYCKVTLSGELNVMRVLNSSTSQMHLINLSGSEYSRYLTVIDNAVHVATDDFIIIENFDIGLKTTNSKALPPKEWTRFVNCRFRMDLSDSVWTVFSPKSTTVFKDCEFVVNVVADGIGLKFDIANTVNFSGNRIVSKIKNKSLNLEFKISSIKKSVLTDLEFSGFESIIFHNMDAESDCRLSNCTFSNIGHIGSSNKFYLVECDFVNVDHITNMSLIACDWARGIEMEFVSVFHRDNISKIINDPHDFLNERKHRRIAFANVYGVKALEGVESIVDSVNKLEGVYRLLGVPFLSDTFSFLENVDCEKVL